MFKVHQHTSIAEISREAWDALWPGEAEAWAYYKAAEATTPKGFAVSYMTVSDGNALVAAAPLFHTRYELYASLRGPVRTGLDAVGRRWPGFLRLGVSGLGSPLVDRCHVGLATALDAEQRAAAMSALLDGLASEGRARGNALLAVKDLEDEVADQIGGDLDGHGFAKIRSLPNSYLDLPYPSWEAFLKAHPRSYWRYLKLKERELPRITITHPEAIGDLSPRLHALFEQTRQQSAGDYGDFEELDPNYFASVKHECGDAAQFMLCWLGDDLVSFQMYMIGKSEVVAKFIGMDYAVARDLNLYFVNINQLIRVCIAAGVPRLRLGNTAYAVKAVYKARLATHWIFFRHRSRAVTWVLKKLAPLIDYERNDPDLAALRKAQPETARRGTG